MEQNRRVMLGGIVGLLMLLQAGAGLFALWYSHASAAQSRAQLGMIADALDTVRSAQASFGVQIQEAQQKSQTQTLLLAGALGLGLFLIFRKK